MTVSLQTHADYYNHYIYSVFSMQARKHTNNLPDSSSTQQDIHLFNSNVNVFDLLTTLDISKADNLVHPTITST